MSLQTAGAEAQDQPPISSSHVDDAIVATDWRGWTKDDCDEVYEVRASKYHSKDPVVVPANQEVQTSVTIHSAWPDEPRQIVGFRAIIDNKKVTADYDLWAVPPVGAKNEGRRKLWDWFPGDEGVFNLPNTGIDLPWGLNALSLRVHYNNLTGPEQTDSSGVALCVVRGARLRRNVARVAHLDIGARVPARTRDHLATRTCVYGSEQPVQLLAVAPGLHRLGSAVRLTVNKAQGGAALHVVDGEYQFGERTTRVLPQAVKLEKGDRVTATCVYDNGSSADAPGGWRSGEEVCRFGITYLPDVAFECNVERAPTAPPSEAAPAKGG